MQSIAPFHARLGFGALFAMAPIAGATCNPAFNSSSISVATSTHGHIAASHGNDGIIRISEFSEDSDFWGGWLNLSKTTDVGSYSDAWIQDYVTGSGNYVYAVKGDSLIQWRLANYSSTFSVFRSALSGATGISGRPASARLSSTIKTAVAANFNGTIMVRANTNGTWGSWTSLSGLSNAQGSPWMTQLPSYQVNLYVRTNDQKIKQNYWNGTSWSGWMEVVSSGVNSDPASTYDGSTGNHYLYYLKTNDVAAQWTYSGGWTSKDLPTFTGKRSYAAVMTGSGAWLYGQDYQGNTFQLEEISGTPSTFEANCLIPYSTDY
jgi:hypothetical protein